MPRQKATLMLNLMLTIAAGTTVSAQGRQSPVACLLASLDSLSLRRAAIAQELRIPMLGSTSPPAAGPVRTLIMMRSVRRTNWASQAPSTTRYFDRIARDLRRRELTLGNSIDFGTVVNEAFRSLKRKPARRLKRPGNLPMPTEEEVAVLQTLWVRGAATSLELYANLDSSLLARTTAERFWADLHRMATRGFVTETLASPQQQLTLGFGPFCVPVELSSKNRRNRIYRYEPLVDKETLLTLLGSTLWLASRGPNTARARSASRLLWWLLQSKPKRNREFQSSWGCSFLRKKQPFSPRRRKH